MSYIIDASTYIPNGSISYPGGTNNSPTLSAQVINSTRASRQTDEQVIEEILGIQASKQEILEALREMFPEKFI